MTYFVFQSYILPSGWKLYFTGAIFCPVIVRRGVTNFLLLYALHLGPGHMVVIVKVTSHLIWSL